MFRPVHKHLPFSADIARARCVACDAEYVADTIETLSEAWRRLGISSAGMIHGLIAAACRKAFAEMGVLEAVRALVGGIHETADIFRDRLGGDWTQADLALFKFPYEGDVELAGSESELVGAEPGAAPPAGTTPAAEGAAAAPEAPKPEGPASTEPPAIVA